MSRSFEEIAAGSTLTASAGEFYPRNYGNQPLSESSDSTSNKRTVTSGSARAGSSRTRDAHVYKENPNVKESGQQVQNAPHQNGRMWRDESHQERRRDTWYRNNNQGQSQRNREGANRNTDLPIASGRRTNNSYGRNRHNNYNSPHNEQTGREDSRVQPNRGKGYESNKSSQNHRGVDVGGSFESVDVNAKQQSHSRNNDFHARGRYNTSERNSREVSEPKSKAEKGRNQMEVLIGQLRSGTLECLVCCEQVKQLQSTWSCRVCYHVLHLRCVIKWANASHVDDSWKCPACRRVSTDMPKEYRCFCGKNLEPQWNRSDCPHTCGSMCGLSRSAPCVHKCTLTCHPGPCPPCQQYVTRQCGCGRVSRTVICTQLDPLVCGSPCGKLLSCGQHKCSSLCHDGPCEKCSQVVKQECFCARFSREVNCAPESVNVSQYSCDSVCSKKLSCENHFCTQNCHSGPCPPCSLLPELTQNCPCGKSKLSELAGNQRKSCLDPIPTCSRVCEELLACGEPGQRHHCNSLCHEGACPPCPETTAVRCRCGHMNKLISCVDLMASSDDARCEKKCNKSRRCGKHKCKEACCIDVDHVCPLPCNKMLSCGSHRCDSLCHTGYCRPCTRDSYQELPCSCGAAVIQPPVPCGTRAPPCSKPCSRPHACSHPPTHNCHDLPDCPPCIKLVEKQCFGGHEVRPAVVCNLEGFSCGLPCGKALPCERHTCILPCHTGECLHEGQTCTQPCTTPRTTCSHPCYAPCHQPPCPDIPCKEMVKVTCECGLRFGSRACVDHALDYQRIMTAQLASKMADIANGSVDLSLVSSNKKISFKTLECNDECKIVERNRRLAVGLQIRNPDLSSKLTPKYSDFLRQWAKRDAYFCQTVHDKLTDLVQLAKQSKQKSRSHSFDSMNREKRHFIHEYCEHFGCESVAYDQEPNRNIVATAIRDKSWLPGLSLLEVVQRESGTRKVPLPSNVNSSRLVPNMRSMEVLPMKSAVSAAAAVRSGLQASGPSVSWRTAPAPAPAPKPSSPVIDYFDMTSS